MKKENLEKDYVDKVEKAFINNGWKTWREAIPDECKSWIKPYRVDLIIFRKNIGLIGFEFKSIKVNNGGVLGKALKQIYRYRNLTYGGRKIKLWALGVKSIDLYKEQLNSVLISELFFQFGIGYFCEYNNINYSSINFSNSDGWAKIKINNSNDRTNILKITQRCEERKNIMS